MDGVDGGEILLIDSQGCPTDVLIMGTVDKIQEEEGKALQAPFEAFKFPTSEIVQFQALITPCLPHCEPANCSIFGDPSSGGLFEAHSYGRRRRRSAPSSETGEQLLVINQLKISDPFHKSPEEEEPEEKDSYNPRGIRESCLNTNTLFFIGSLFVAVQIAVIGGWFCLWRQRNNSRKEKEFEANYAFGPALHHVPFPQKMGRLEMPVIPRL